MLVSAGFKTSLSSWLQSFRPQSVLGTLVSSAERLNRSTSRLRADSRAPKKPRICGARWSRLANTVERSVRRGDENYSVWRLLVGR